MVLGEAREDLARGEISSLSPRRQVGFRDSCARLSRDAVAPTIDA
jgi:hypothetical protein